MNCCTASQLQEQWIVCCIHILRNLSLEVASMTNSSKYKRAILLHIMALICLTLLDATS